MSDTYRVRASSWASLFDCAHRWEGTHILGMRMPSSPRAQLGTAIHAATAAFDEAVLAGQAIRPVDVAPVLVDELTSPDREVDWSADELTRRDAERIGLQLVTRYCLEIAPRYHYVAVELEVVPWLIDCGGGIVIEIRGTLDRSRARADGTGGVGICDLKSGVNAVSQGRAKTKGHAPQIGTYELLYERTTGQAVTLSADIIGLKTSGAPEVAVGHIHNAREQLIGSDDSPGLMDYAADMFRSGLFPPNPTSHRCSAKYCARWRVCKFKDDQP
ncbi:RecB family exonuclease [Chromobacterium subtsugae]|uniref:RecB family exonuclease n=1 Tax=Chromobacterium subtsugae TaxID=251747 RepID=UPI000640C16E|nr:PD-(D/E)XK nuclease family protein [Chromobacterium subtsugae]